MVDITMEILASSVPIRNGYMARYRVKTWWAHIDVPPDVTYIKLPRLPMLQPFLIMTGKDTTVFVETWQDHKNAIVGGGGGDAGIPLNKTRFLGITTCSVDEQLKAPNLNPSVQWLDVHDPIEDESRGKLLVKIDAKFVLPDESRNRISSPSLSENHQHGLGHHETSPVKIVNSPRRSLAPNFQFDYHQSSPSIQHVSSRKSDTSVFSVRSGSSTRSQEQGVQTDLSLPIIPDISKYTAALNSRSSSLFVEESSLGAHKVDATSNSRSGSSSSVATAIPAIIDPMKLAEDILRRNLATNAKNNVTSGINARMSEPLPQPKKLPQSTSSDFRRSCLARQHIQQRHYYDPEQQQQRLAENNKTNATTKPPKNYNMESLDDVIDMLNKDGREREALFSPAPSTHPINTGMLEDSRWTSSNNPTQQQRSSAITRSVATKPSPDRRINQNNNGFSSEGIGSDNSSQIAFKRDSISSTSSSTNQFHRQEGGIGGVSDRVRNDNRVSSPYHQQQGRFKESHFDGVKDKQQATSILMTRTTAQATTNPPLVTRRRIAAAIFND